MAYNSYNTRILGRYNATGRSVGEQYRQNQRQCQQQTQQTAQQNQQQPQQQQQLDQPQQQQQQQQKEQDPPQQHQPIQPQPSPPAQPIEVQNPMVQVTDLEMKIESGEPVKESPNIYKPYWVRNKLNGVKKLSNKERRRRQNENLRRLLAPKNALMVLNEMLPGERDIAQFKVEPAPPHPYYNAANVQSFCAELTVDGVTYKGYGDNKIAARNDAAEQAIRDLIIKRMAKVRNVETTTTASVTTDPEGQKQPSVEEEQALPMIQLASFALHKLFVEWECDGHKVPQLKAIAPSQVSDAGSEVSAPTGRSKPHRAVPPSAATMHPCMLLTYMRPHLEYRELAVDGDRPQNMMFTMGIDVDGSTYIGKATNKREARKQAARAACSTLFGVTFADAPVANVQHKPKVA